jgi:hypothetical protein
MDTILIATTRQEGLHAIGTGGQPVIQAYDQLARYLRRSFSEEHARLFAEPNHNPSRGTVDWYAAADGPLVPLTEAGPDLRHAVETRLARLRDDIRQRAGVLAKSGDGGDRLLGQMLELALEIPSEDHIYCVGEQPVLACWGMLRDEPQAERGVLRKFVPYTPPPPPPPPPPEPSAAEAVPAGGAALASAPAAVTLVERPLWWLAWLLWLVFALLIAGIFIVLLSGCGIGPSWLAGRGFVNLCPGPAVAADPRESPELQAELARERVLEGEIRRLQRRVALERRRCATAREAPPEGAPSGPGSGSGDGTGQGDGGQGAGGDAPDEQTFDDRLEREGGETGAITVTLAWEGRDDLDLRVRCPDDSQIYFGNQNACGGELDVDMNAGGRMSDEPVENVVWPEGAAPPGRYAVIVDNFYGRDSGEDPTPFRVRIRIGDRVEIVEGSVAAADTPPVVYEFEVP